LPGLKFSKESLKPHHMAKKFVVTPTFWFMEKRA
jgi:hypothetical protein